LGLKVEVISGNVRKGSEDGGRRVVKVGNRGVIDGMKACVVMEGGKPHLSTSETDVANTFWLILSVRSLRDYWAETIYSQA